MSESAEKILTPPGDVAVNAGIHLGSLDDDTNKGDTTTNTPSQILLEALRNFVIPLIHIAEGKNENDTRQVPLGLEAERLLTALQEFISSMIIQSRSGQQGIEVDLEAPNVESTPDPVGPAQAESSGTATGSTGSDSGFHEEDAMDESPDTETDRIAAVPNLGLLEDFAPAQSEYQRFMGRFQEAFREHVFSKMPIRVLHFTNTLRDPGTKLRITLLDRNGVYSRVIEEIQANYSQSIFETRVEFYKTQDSNDEDQRQFVDSIIAELIQEYTQYAILSHTWLRGSDSEVTYGDWQKGQFNTRQPGYQKLANFCKSAWKDHGVSFGWMDTVCINKDSSSELDESIRSMYKWYQYSSICITYLAETLTFDNIYRDPWFTRGWTFQELLAPKFMTFYNRDWKKFVPYTHPGDKRNQDISDQLYQATTIREFELYHPNDMLISRKMQLAANRNVTREEDTAYSLMGICNVSISIAYGEGAKRAFFRLMTEILNSSPVAVDLFNCAQIGQSSIIPSGPSAYLHCSKDVPVHYLPIEPLLLTHVGLRMPILLMPSLRERDPCLESDPIGDYYATVNLPALEHWSTGSFRLLDKGITSSTFYNKWTFGIFNFGGDRTSIDIPNYCLAVCFSSQRQVEWDSTSNSDDIERIDTKEPIVFRLMNRKLSASIDGSCIHSLKRSEVAKHGMILTTMYL